MKLTVHAVSRAVGRFGVCSIPVLPGWHRLEPAGSRSTQVQCVPVGYWPDGYADRPQFAEVWRRHGWSPPPRRPPGERWPRRLLSFMDFNGLAPQEFELTAAPANRGAVRWGAVDDERASAGWAVRVHQNPLVLTADDQQAHYCTDRDAAVELKHNGRELTLRLGLCLPDGQVRRWQWANAQRLWGGPMVEGWQFGGHIYAGPDDRRMTKAEARQWWNTPFADEHMIMVKVFAWLLRDGEVLARAHFVNGELYGRGVAVHGRPLVHLASEAGLATVDSDQGAWRLDSTAQEPFGGHTAGAFKRTADGVDWFPFDDTRMVLGNRQPVNPDQPFETVSLPGSEWGLCAGAARTAVFAVLPPGTSPPVRYLASPSDYLLAAELMIPLELPDPGERPTIAEWSLQLSDAARRVFLRNHMPRGFAAGGVFRYLDGFPDQRWEFSCDGNETASLFRGSYLFSDSALYHLAMRAADFNADLGCHHSHFHWRYHSADTAGQQVYSLIYLRFGGLVHAHLETGDPYYLETAEAVANRWIAQHRAHWPRQNIGRDAEPVEGILLLHDFTGVEHYFDAARQVARDVAASLTAQGHWRSGAGVGPHWGVNALPGNAWNGSHLLAGLAEFLVRDDPADPWRQELLEAGRRLMQQWLDLLDEQGGFHRAAVSFAWRRHLAMTQLLEDSAIQQRLLRVLDTTLRQYETDGDGFFTQGHHCGGYLDGPWFFAASIPDAVLQEWSKLPSRLGHNFQAGQPPSAVPPTRT